MIKNKNYQNILVFAITLCALLCIILLVLRLNTVFSFSVPFQVFTSGYEEESLIAIWNVINGFPLYVSRFEFPYRWAIYNWLYYYVYAGISGNILNVFSLNDEWLPTITRLITLVGSFSVAIITYNCLASILQKRNRIEGMLILGFAVLVGLGPLTGFWVMTTRPDLWAAFFDIACFFVFVRFYRFRPYTTIFCAALLAYVAWGFKQSEVISAISIILFLCLHKEWKQVFVFSMLIVISFLVTIIIGGNVYFTSITLGEYEGIVTFRHGLYVLVSVLPKFIPGYALGMFLAFQLVRGVSLNNVIKHFISTKEEILAIGIEVCVIAVVVSIVIIGATSFHSGAADNYYFTLCFFLSVLCVLGYRIGYVKGSIGWMTKILCFSWGLQALAILAVLMGIHCNNTTCGTIATSFASLSASSAAAAASMDKRKEHMQEYKNCIGTQEAPVFVNNSYFSLPWMTKNSVQSVLAFGYFEDRQRGRQYEFDGLGGLIQKGYFSTIILLDKSITDTFDGGLLSGYRLTGKECEGYRIFDRIDVE